MIDIIVIRRLRERDLKLISDPDRHSSTSEPVDLRFGVTAKRDRFQCNLPLR